jgi:hypothetical protein
MSSESLAAHALHTSIADAGNGSAGEAAVSDFDVVVTSDDEAAVQRFVCEHSSVLKAAREDDPSASWHAVFPPACTESASAWDRTRSTVETLASLMAEPLDWRRILWVRSRSLYSSLGGLATEQLIAALDLADYLQLPKSLSQRLREQAAVVELREAVLSTSTGGELLCVLDECPVLQQAVMVARAKLVAPFVGRPMFASGLYDGAAGFPFTGLKPIAAEAGADSAADGAAAAAPLVRWSSDAAHHAAAESAGYYAAGRILAGRALELGDTSICVSDAPALAACSTGDAAALRALQAAGWAVPLDVVVPHAARCGSVPVLQWCHDSGFFEAHPHSFDAGDAEAARAGRTLVLRWARQARGCLKPGLDVVAADAGQTAVIQFLCGEVPGYEKSQRACLAAVQADRLPALQCLAAHGYSLTPELVVTAAALGRRSMAAFMRAHGVEWRVAMCRVVARQGSLDTLQWLRAQEPPCPWDGSVIVEARLNGFTTVEEWARENGCPEPGAVGV